MKNAILTGVAGAAVLVAGAMVRGGSVIGINYDTVGEQNEIRRYDTSDGSSVLLGTVMFSSGGYFGQTVTSVAGSIEFYAMSADSTLYTFSKATGATLNSVATGYGDPLYLNSALPVAGGAMRALVYNNNPGVQGFELHAVDAVTGATAVLNTSTGVTQPTNDRMVYVDGTIFVPQNLNTLLRFEAITGASAGSLSLGQSFQYYREYTDGKILGVNRSMTTEAIWSFSSIDATTGAIVALGSVDLTLAADDFNPGTFLVDVANGAFYASTSQNTTIYTLDLTTFAVLDTAAVAIFPQVFLQTISPGQVVPEPGSAMAVAGGVAAGLGGRRRRA